MTKNMGTVDRLARALLGVIIISLGLYFQSWWGAIGLIPLATAAVGFCGLYPLLGISTCKISPDTEDT